MTFNAAPDPTCTAAEHLVRQVIKPTAKDLGGFSVRRVLPAPRQRSLGPFVFFDEFGPTTFPPGEGIAVRPHPHIGLATVTYLFEGEIMHRDSLGYVQPIRPGAVNLMTAGRGIVHSERAGEDLHDTSKLHGLQTWMALPGDEQEAEPAFVHHPADTIPEIEIEGGRARVVIGEAFGVRSPVAVRSRTLYLELELEAGCRLALPTEDELGLYLVSGSVALGGQPIAPATMAIFDTNGATEIVATEDSHLMVLGGTSLGHRYLWWNFVSDSRERIAQAKVDWAEGRFGQVPGDDEFIPLPD